MVISVVALLAVTWVLHKSGNNINSNNTHIRDHKANNLIISCQLETKSKKSFEKTIDINNMMYYTIYSDTKQEGKEQEQEQKQTKNKDKYEYVDDVDVDVKEKTTEINIPVTSNIIMEVTAYTSGYESTGKTQQHPDYGLTASGEMVQRFKTVAASRGIPFGTKLRIPEFEEFKGVEEEIIFEVQDRGGDIVDGRLDVYVEDVGVALEWGRRFVEVEILE